MKRSLFVCIVAAFGLAAPLTPVQGACPALDHTYQVDEVRLDGLAYNTDTRRLFGVTGAGYPDTLFEMDLQGNVVNTYPLLFNGYPGSSSGLAYRPDHAHLLLSDTVCKCVYEFTPDGHVFNQYTVATPSEIPAALAFDAESGELFVSIFQFAASTVRVVDPTNGAEIRSFPVPTRSFSGLAFLDRVLWGWDPRLSTLWALDPADGAVLDVCAVPPGMTGTGFEGLEAVEGDLYMFDSERHGIGPHTMYVYSFPVPRMLRECAATAKNHGQYVSCVARSSKDLVEQGVIDASERDRIISEAAQSDVGKK